MADPKNIGKYDIIEEIGRGGFAVVYKARDTHMERQVALKVITGGLADESTFIQRFRREARTAANLSHPNVVPVYDFGDADGALYLAMALIGQGRTLRHLLAERALLSLDQALPILTPLAAALDYLHQCDPPLTHRDVKPANVLLAGDEDSPWVVLTDFGLVRSLQASTELTRSGSILGTPAYMAPELADAKQWGEVTPLTDVYALGVMAYEMLTGRAPFEGEALAVLHAHAYDPPPLPLELLPDLGDDLSAVLLRALNKPPAERYPSAGAFVAALQTVAKTWAEAKARESTLEQLEAQARELLAAGEWLEALDRCTQMVRLDPDRPAALGMLTAAKQGLDRELAEAVKRRRLAERYQKGLDLLKEEKWRQAVAALEEVAEGNPDFRDVQEKLAQARDELQRAQGYDEAIAHGEAGRWAEACRAWVKVLRNRLDYRDGDAAERLLDASEGLLSQRIYRLQGILGVTTCYYHHTLLHSPEAETARAYVANCGLRDSTIEQFQLGYSLPGWRNTRGYLTERGYTIEELIEVGLVIEREEGSEYDRFRERLMIPICDAVGQVVGFVGRTIEPERVPRTLYSPKTILFDRSAILFGLDVAQEAIRRENRVVILDDFMNVMQAHQAGFENTVAYLGTMLTEPQLKQLYHYTKQLVLVLSADKKIALRSSHDDVSWEGWEEPNLSLRDLRWHERRFASSILVLQLQSGQNPEDLIRKTPNLWTRSIEEAVPVNEFYLPKRYVEKIRVKQPEGTLEAEDIPF